MKLEKLTLTNFRGFEQIELDFEQDLTVIAGVNGIGKSSILGSIATVANHLLPVISAARLEKDLELSRDDIHRDKPALAISALWSTAAGPFHAQVVRSVNDPSKTEEYKERRDQARRAQREVPKGSKEDKALDEEIRYLGELLRPEKDYFSYQAEYATSAYVAIMRSHEAEPLVIHYSTERYFRGMPKKLLDVKSLSPRDASTDALGGKDVNLNEFANWFRFVQTGRSAEFGKMLLVMLDEAITKLLPGFSKPQLVHGVHTHFRGTTEDDLGEFVKGSLPHFTVVKAGKSFKLGQLSDGEQGLLALVFDLTRRLALANPKSENPLKEGVAVVLIDEIELHLHPTWQRRVLRYLGEIFPCCQFIVTTHSPMILGEVIAEKIYFLAPDKENGGKIMAKKPTEAYGLDVNRILDELMGASERNSEMEAKLRKLFDSIDQEDFAAAKKQITALIKKLGENDPEITRANALIKFLEADE